MLKVRLPDNRNTPRRRDFVSPFRCIREIEILLLTTNAQRCYSVSYRVFSPRHQPVALQLENARIRIIIILLYTSLFFVGRCSSLLPRFISVSFAPIMIVF